MTDAPGTPVIAREAPSAGGGWGAPLLLLGAVLFTSVFSAGVLIGIPLIALVLFLPVEHKRAVFVAALFALWIVTAPGNSGLWWIERGWAAIMAGWFVALSLRWPDAGFFRRGFSAVVGTVGVFALSFALRPDAWAAIDWRVGERIRLGIGMAMESLGIFGDAPLAPETREAIHEAIGVQIELFPAILALGSLAALGLAWWMYGRWACGSARPLGRVKEFRFSDHLVWLLIVGLALVLFGVGDGWARAGSNTLVFMGTLYVLRGVGVVLFVNGGMSIFGAVVFALAVLFVAPIVIAGMLVIGVGDTWLDLRRRVRSDERMTPGE
ncbi:MAG: DUF2232 domain-containing protein [Longimicrobiales bacterium]|nr:DUF2232 domain-containing protein [Longimicrobiales bacterium]